MNQIQQAPATGTQTAQSSGPANGQLRQMPLPGFSNESQPPSPGEQRAEERAVGSQIPEEKPASVAEAGSRRRFSEITRQWLHFGRFLLMDFDHPNKGAWRMFAQHCYALVKIGIRLGTSRRCPIFLAELEIGRAHV